MKYKGLSKKIKFRAVFMFLYAWRINLNSGQFSTSCVYPNLYVSLFLMVKLNMADLNDPPNIFILHGASIVDDSSVFRSESYSTSRKTK
jgi:hypothetical protein